MVVLCMGILSSQSVKKTGFNKKKLSPRKLWFSGSKPKLGNRSKNKFNFGTSIVAVANILPLCYNRVEGVW